MAPRLVRRAVHRVRRYLESRRNAGQDPEYVFSNIYREGKWGTSLAKKRKEGAPYFSGTGSSSETIVGPYVDAIRTQLQGYWSNKPRYVDLGCGDFTVGRHFLAQCSEYVGVDVVPDLIDHLRATVQHDHVRFLCLDITSQDLPEGDVCLLRQVLQHLSNAQILKIIPKLYKYQRVYVTEHYPADTKEIVPNRDKIHGADIRLYDNSGVYLDLPPFNLPSSMLELILEVRAGDFGDLYEGGWIRTYMLKPT